MAGALAACDTGEVERTQGEAGASLAAETEWPNALVVRDFAGSTIPDVVVSDPTGTTLALAQTGGKPVLLNLWATWCAPCIVEMPMLDSLSLDLREELRVITVSEDITGAEAVTPFFEEYGFSNLPRWMDANNALAEAFGGGAALPLSVLYNGQGEEVLRVLGPYHWASEEGRALVAEATEPAS